jgi:hypothetical protein
MPTQTTTSAPWQDLEKQAYHSYREWHLWLALRERELAERHTALQSGKRPSGAAPAVERPERQATAKKGRTE